MPKHCSPKHSNNGHTCYTLKHLLSIAKAINHNSHKHIDLKLNKYKLWNAIRQTLSDKCSDKQEWCWIDHDLVKHATDTDSLSLHKAFRPTGPLSKDSWLSTNNILSVMKQYEEIYTDFVFFGPVPIDFKNVSKQVANINIKKLISQGIHYIGLVFNTDPSHLPGKHWISMFINLHSHQINYFDSNPVILPDEINDLINHLAKQFELLGHTPIININTVRHQFGKSECGTYAIFFITQSLKGITFHNIVNNIIKDQQMHMFRHTLFRPY